MKRSLVTLSLSLLFAVLLTACDFGAQATSLRVRVVVDGNTVTLTATDPVSVSQFLQRNNIPLGELDRVDPSDFTLIADNMTITVVRVQEKVECTTEAVPFKTETLPVPELKPGQSQIVQAGTNGEAQVCATVRYENGVEKDRLTGSTTILTQPKSQVIAVGVDKSKIEPITVAGMIVYLSGGQARSISASSTTQALLPTGGNLDGRVFALSPDGRHLLYTRKKDRPEPTATTVNGTPNPVVASAKATASPITGGCDVQNELWVLMDTSDPNATPTQLILNNVLTAEWLPSQALTFSFSTFETRPDAPCYQALNDLTLAQVQPGTGKLLTAQPAVSSRPMGIYGTWGMDFRWSPNGTALAWSLPDGVGLVDFQKKSYVKLFDFPVYSTTLSRGWVWKPNLSWTSDGTLLTATIHGAPITSEPPENSPAFDIAVSQPGSFAISQMIKQVGMWAAPEYSPLVKGAGDSVSGYMAYLQARDDVDSVSSEYDLIIADRDGSNPHVVFPTKDKFGLKPIDDGSDFTWSPDGSRIALVYQGDVYIIEIASGRATRVTLVENARLPRWVK